MVKRAYPARTVRASRVRGKGVVGRALRLTHPPDRSSRGAEYGDPIRSVVLELQPQRAQLVADFVERGHAEVLALEELITRPLGQIAHRLDVELAHAFASTYRKAQLADRLDQQGLHLGGHLLGRISAMVLRGHTAIAAFEGHAQPHALGGHHLLDLGERGLAKVLAGQKRGFGGACQVSERADVHLAKAVAAPNRKLEVGHGYLEKLLRRLAVSGLLRTLRLAPLPRSAHDPLPELGTAEAQAVAPDRGPAVVAERRAHAPRVVAPRAAPDHAVGGRGIGRRRRARLLSIVFHPNILAPH